MAGAITDGGGALSRALVTSGAVAAARICEAAQEPLFIDDHFTSNWFHSQMPWKNVMDRSADAMPEHLGAFNPSDWSLVNFILELKDLKPLLKKYHTKRSFFRSFLQYFNEGITIEGILALIGSQYLEVKFGIEPFFQDLSTILDKLNTFDERFENYLSHRGKDLHRN
jgi:hypothetical protein